MNNHHQHKPVIGLVGGVGSGKTAAAGEFEALRLTRIDCDAIGHQLLAEQDIRQQIRGRWGEQVFGPDGEVDRRVLGEIVFSDPAELEALNEIMQHRIRNQIESQLTDALADDNVTGVVIDAAILFEAGWDDMCTHVLFVAAPAADRMSRAGRRGLDEDAWSKRENSQISLDTKQGRCYCNLDNSSSVSHLREQVRGVFSRLVDDVDRF